MEGHTDEIKAQRKPGFSRFMFIEACFRMAKLLYASNVKVDAYNDDPDDMNAKYAVKMNQAFEMFYKTVLLPYKKAQSINWQKFRDNKLNDY